jgi:hypothetical protein
VDMAGHLALPNHKGNLLRNHRDVFLALAVLILVALMGLIILFINLSTSTGSRQPASGPGMADPGPLGAGDFSTVAAQILGLPSAGNFWPGSDEAGGEDLLADYNLRPAWLEDDLRFGRANIWFNDEPITGTSSTDRPANLDFLWFPESVKSVVAMEPPQSLGAAGLGGSGGGGGSARGGGSPAGGLDNSPGELEAALNPDSRPALPPGEEDKATGVAAPLPPAVWLLGSGLLGLVGLGRHRRLSR